MPERDYGAEIDALRRDINEIKKLLKGSKPDSKIVDKIKDMTPDKNLNSLMDRIQNECETDGSIGKVVYLGVFASGGRQSNWINELKADDLLKLIENRTAEKVLACIGSSDKLNILLALLKKPMTVAQLVSECGFNSTGQVYHHLNTLIAADLVKEDLEYGSKGSYVVTPHRVQGVIMLLSGINDMLDTRYSSGSWNESK